RGESGRCTGADGAGGAAVAKVDRDQVGGLWRAPGQPPVAVCDVAVRRPVEAVAPDLVATVERVRNRVQVGVRRQRLMERRIEYRDLRNVAERLADRKSVV